MSQESITLHITSLRKDRKPKFEVWFLLSEYHFHTTVQLLKNHKWNHHKLETYVLAGSIKNASKTLRQVGPVIYLFWAASVSPSSSLLPRRIKRRVSKWKLCIDCLSLNWAQSKRSADRHPSFLQGSAVMPFLEYFNTMEEVILATRSAHGIWLNFSAPPHTHTHLRSGIFSETQRQSKGNFIFLVAIKKG